MSAVSTRLHITFAKGMKKPILLMLFQLVPITTTKKNFEPRKSIK